MSITPQRGTDTHGPPWVLAEPRNGVIIVLLLIVVVLTMTGRIDPRWLMVTW